MSEQNPLRQKPRQKSLKELGRNYEKIHKECPQVLDVLKIINKLQKKEDIKNDIEEFSRKYEIGFDTYLNVARDIGLICKDIKELTGAGRYYLELYGKSSLKD